jgi:hypothetical protein
MEEAQIYKKHRPEQARCQETLFVVSISQRSEELRVEALQAGSKFEIFVPQHEQVVSSNACPG